MKTLNGFSHIWVGDKRGPYSGGVWKHFVFFLTYEWVINGDRMETLFTLVCTYAVRRTMVLAAEWASR